MKSILFGLLFSAALLYASAQEEPKPKDSDIKIYKRLIPADVLRGEFIDSSHVLRFDCVVDQLGNKANYDANNSYSVEV